VAGIVVSLSLSLKYSAFRGVIVSRRLFALLLLVFMFAAPARAGGVIEVLPVILDGTACTPVYRQPTVFAAKVECVPAGEMVLVLWRRGRSDALVPALPVGYWRVNYRGLVGWARLVRPTWTGMPS
jgi:hypothetical protein